MKTKKIMGVEIFYEDLGDPKAKQTIAFLNGVMASTNSWERIYPQFVSRGYRVILHDFKGQLRSEKPDAEYYSFAEHVEETMALLKELGAKNVHFIGTSYGGEVALRLAILYPNFPTSLTIIDSVSETDDIMRAFVESWKILCDNCDGAGFFYGMLPSIYGGKFIAKNQEMLSKRAQAMTKVDSDYFKGQKMLYETFVHDVYMTDRLKEISCPTLLICGAEDILKPPKFSQIIADEIAGAEFITIPGSGHVAIFEKPNEIVSAALGFITKHSSKTC